MYPRLIKENFGQEQAPWVVLARGIDFIENVDEKRARIMVPHTNGKTYEIIVMGVADLTSEKALTYRIWEILDEVKSV